MFHFRTRRRTFAIGFFAFVAQGCAIIGGTSPNLRHANGYDVTPPKGWVESPREESDRAYRLASGNVVTLVSSCNRNSEAPLEVLTRHLLIGTRNTRVVHRNRVKFGENEGLYSAVIASVEKTPLNLELFVTTRSGCVFDFSLLSPKTIPAGDRAEFQQFISSFRYGTN